MIIQIKKYNYTYTLAYFYDKIKVEKYFLYKMLYLYIFYKKIPLLLLFLHLFISEMLILNKFKALIIIV